MHTKEERKILVSYLNGDENLYTEKPPETID